MRVEIDEAAERLDDLIDGLESGKIAEIVLTRADVPSALLVGLGKEAEPANS